jgi:simple sugar transport system permease protein
MNGVVSLGFVAATARITVPYALAALGGTYSERAGVINIALEGLLLVGAFASACAALTSGSALVGVLGGVAAGLLLAAAYALLVLLLRADQIVCGVALNLLADGLSRFLLKALYGSSSNSPRIGPFAGGRAYPLMLAAAALVALSHLVFSRTRFGLRLRATGEHPEAVASLGVSPLRVRFAALLCAGALGGLGGAWLAVDQKQFVAGMSNGRGYIALAAMIFGGWRPVWAALAGLVFGACEALEIALQAAGLGLPEWAIQTLPYAVTIALLSGRKKESAARAPAALGKPL